MNMNRARTTLASVVFALLACVPLLAAYTHSFHMEGNNDPRAANYLGFSAHGYISADPTWYGYPNGPTFIKVRLDGYTPTCGNGWRENDWCVDNAHNNGFGGWNSQTSAHVTNIVPFGCYTATIMAWVADGTNLVENYPIAKCFDDPPPSIPGDGYCVTYDYDPGQGAYVCNTSPILIDTAGKKATYVLSPRGVLFDINADGTPDRINWTLPNSTVAFLALDRNGNGKIDDGRELFGGVTVPGAPNGFSALRKLSGAEFGYVDATHGGELFARLLLWHDRNANGESEPDELSPASATLEAIGLGYQLGKDTDTHGNIFAQKSFARLKPEPTNNRAYNTYTAATREFPIYDVSFATK